MLTSVENYNEALKILRTDSSVSHFKQENLLDAEKFNQTFESFETSINSLYEKTRIAFELREHIERYVNERIDYAKKRADKAAREAEAALNKRLHKDGYRYYIDSFIQENVYETNYDRNGEVFDACKVYNGQIIPSTSIASGGQHATIFNEKGEITINMSDYDQSRGVQLLIEDELRLGGAVSGVFVFVPDVPIVANKISFNPINGHVKSITVYDKYNIETKLSNVETGVFREQEVHKVKFTVVTTQEVI